MMPDELRPILDDIRAELADLNARVTRLEDREAPPPPPAPVAEGPSRISPPAMRLTEEKLLAISAAVAAFLGVHVRIRQIRLVSSPAWAQQGRLWVQASHQFHHE
jgi:methylmalonyl-CoA carboxyltransferase large subunit